MKKIIVCFLLLLVFGTLSAWDDFTQYSIADDLKKPGVKLIAVDFYTTGCPPCDAAIPKWKELQKIYGNKGLELIVVSSVVKSDGRCAQPPQWNPDKTVCDSDGKIADAWHVAVFPEAFLWRWDGKLLVSYGTVDNVASAIEDYFNKEPRILIEEGSDRNIYQLVRSELKKNSKFEILSSEEERKELAKVREESTHAEYDDKLRCKGGVQVSANSLLKISEVENNLILELLSAETDCLTASGSAEMRENIDTAVKEAVSDLLKKLLGVKMPEKMKTQEIHALKLGGVALGAMPKIEVKEANFGSLQSTYSVSELNTNIGISLDADPDILVFYDKCVKADKTGEQNPQNAIDLWQQLAEIKENNPFLNQAEQRVGDWKKYVYLKKMSFLFENAKEADEVGQIFPQKAMEAWGNVYIEESDDFDNPYEQTAEERLKFWEQYEKQVEKYQKQLLKFEEQRKEDKIKLEKILPLEVINDTQKRTLLVQYMEIYSPLYGIEDVNDIIYSTDKATSKHIYGLLYNDYLKKEMVGKCDEGNGSACYISALLTEVEDRQKAYMFFVQACHKGIANACVKTGEFYYDRKQFKAAAKNFYKACGMESPEGCYLAAVVNEKGSGVEENLIMAGEIYQKACNLGHKASCKPAKKLLDPEQLAKIQKEKIEKEINKAGRKKRIDIATGLLVPGLLIAAGGGVAFYGMNKADCDSKNYFDRYLDAPNETDAINYRKKTNDADKKRKTYLILGSVGAGVGIALIATSIVLYSIEFKNEKEVKKKYNLSFTTNPSNGTLQFALNW